MKWDIHIRNIVSKTKYLVYVFYRLKKVMTTRQLIKIYYGLFNSIAVYGIIGWGGLYNSALEPLNRLQKKIVNVIGVKEEDKPLDIRQIFVVKCIVFLYKELKNEFLMNTINTRFKSIMLPKHSLTIGQRSFDYYARKYYNKLPVKLKDLTVSDKTIKTKVKEEIRKLTIL